MKKDILLIAFKSVLLSLSFYAFFIIVAVTIGLRGGNRSGGGDPIRYTLKEVLHFNSNIAFFLVLLAMFIFYVIYNSKKK
jgi:hypothetical protein